MGNTELGGSYKAMGVGQGGIAVQAEETEQPSPRHTTQGPRIFREQGTQQLSMNDE